MSTTTQPIRVFLAVRTSLRTRVTYRAVWVTRGHGTEVYKSAPCEDEDKARTLAAKWLARNPGFTAVAL
jgi:hypothetical protein